MVLVCAPAHVTGILSAVAWRINSTTSLAAAGRATSSGSMRRPDASASYACRTFLSLLRLTLTLG